MSAEALERYRALRAALNELRTDLATAGMLEEGCPAEDDILDRMDVEWEQLTVEERALLNHKGV